MLSKRYESTEVDRRTWLHVPSGTHWSTSSNTHQVVEIQIETSTTSTLKNIKGVGEGGQGGTSPPLSKVGGHKWVCAPPPHFWAEQMF